MNLTSSLNKFANLNAKIFAPLHINNYLDQNKIKKNKIGLKIPFSGKINNFYKIKKGINKFDDQVNKFLMKRFNPDVYHTTYYDKKPVKLPEENGNNCV